MKRHIGEWRSERAERTFRAADAARWAEATATPPETLDVDTGFGSTRAYRWPGRGPDIVLLHGVGDTSFRWIPFAEALPEFNVFAIDIMGDVGDSKPELGYETGDDLGVWLGQAIDALALAAPHLAGMSLGGYVALSHAVQGGAAGSLTLFDPVGLVELRMGRFIRWGAATALAAVAPGPIRRSAGRRLRQPMLDDRADVRAYLKGSVGHPMALPPLPVFTDEQLATISAPVRVVAGAQSPPFDGEALVGRVTASIRRGHARLLPDAGHTPALTHHDICLAELRSAIAGDTPEREPSR
ncbi:MAG: alpha/beta hydrolase [Actinomycetota bacterium]